MTDVTRILSQINDGDPSGRRAALAAGVRRAAQVGGPEDGPGEAEPDSPGYGFGPRGVHSARGCGSGSTLEQPRPFLRGRAEAMRRILVEHAREKQRLKHGGDLQRVDLPDRDLVADDRVEEILRVHEALDALAHKDPQAAELVKLRFFVGLTLAEAAVALDIPRRTIDRLWVYAKAWLGAEFRR